jgi:CMP-N-acetylneuraminic acid synthetase
LKNTKPKILAIIPARGGSKGIVKKNLASAFNKPLIQWSIEAAIQCSTIDKIVVSSDDIEILETAKKFGVFTLPRPLELAQDHSSSESVLKHCLEQLSSNNEHFDYAILLQPTSPARNAIHLKEAINYFENTKATSLISVYAPEHSPYKSFTLTNEGLLTGIINNELPFMPRQALPKTYYPNGAIYIINVCDFLEKNSFFTDQCVPFIMSKDVSIDIDTPACLDKFNQSMRNKNDND